MTLEQSTGTVYGCVYHTVKPLWQMYQGDNADWNKMVTWAVVTYGPGPDDGAWTPNARWYVNNAKFWFRDLEDITMFMLKWS